MKSSSFAPSSKDEGLMPDEREITKRVINGDEAREAAFLERVRRFTPGLLLQIFALCKFIVILFMITNMPLNEKEIPIVALILFLNGFFLLASTVQDICSLILTSIFSVVFCIFYFLMLITIPIFVTGYFASGSAKYTSVPQEFRIFSEIINYGNREEKLFQEGVQYGLSVEIVLLFIFVVTFVQCALLNATLNAKLNHSTRQRQEKEKRNSVYLI